MLYKGRMSGICYWTARELLGALDRRELSSREIVQAHLEQIERVNPAVNAVVTLVAERALEEADRADRALAARERQGPLGGLPLAHKDLHDTAGIRTTYGSPLWADHVPDRNDLVVDRIHAAGGITIGKTNTPEFGAGSHTFNPVFGATHNPYDQSRSAGGSSGGAAAGLACGMFPLAEGSDTGGSLRNPASFDNVVGFRPSPGRVPNWPSQLGWTTLNVKGPMARTVADAALLLSALAGPDPRAPISLETPGSAFDVPLDRDLRGLRVAWSPDLGARVPVEAEVAEVVRQAAGVLEDLGCGVEEACPDLGGADEVFLTLRAWMFNASYGPLVDAHPGQVKETIRWNVQQGRRLSGADLSRAEALHTALHERVVAFFRSYDMLLLPVSQVPPFPIDLEYPTEVAGVKMETYLDWMRSCTLISATGCPALSVPGGFTTGGLPVGVQLVTAPRQDLLALQVGHAFEQATRHGERRPAIALD